MDLAQRAGTAGRLVRRAMSTQNRAGGQSYIWNAQAESMPRAELSELQGERLKQQVARAYQQVPFYRQAFEQRGVHPGDIRSIQDIERLPFTVKDDFRATYPYGLFAVPLREVVRVHASSGTTGKPVIGGYTRADMVMWAEVMGRAFAAGGVT